MIVELSREEVLLLKAFIGLVGDFMGLVCMEGVDGRQYNQAKELINSKVKKLAVDFTHSVAGKHVFDKYKTNTHPEILCTEYEEDQHEGHS